MSETLIDVWDVATFDDLAQQAKAGCVISRALAVPVQLQATLEAN